MSAAVPEVRIAIVGYGSIARSHASALRALPVVRALGLRPVIAAIVTERPDAVRGEALALGVERVVPTVEEALAGQHIDLVDVTSRNDQHAAAARAAFDAGCSVYIEKPIGFSAEEAAAIAALAAASPRPSQAGLVLRYDPSLVTARALLRLGAIGTVRHARMGSFHGSYLNPARPMSWRLRRASAGGGAMLDLGLHLIDAARFLLGEVRVERSAARTIVPRRPSAEGPDADVDVDDWSWAELSFGDARVTIEASRIAFGAETMPLELYGSEGSLVGDLRRGDMELRRFDGRESAFRQRAAEDAWVKAVQALRPPAPLTLGSFVDLHAAGLHHVMRRLRDEDPAPGLAPTLADSAAAEALAHRITADLQLELSG
jgi:predicted dehydrogenase